MSGEQLNYYYLGQLMAGMLIRLTGVEPSAGLQPRDWRRCSRSRAVTAFAIGATLAEAGRRRGLPVKRPLLAGGCASVLLLAHRATCAAAGRR